MRIAALFLLLTAAPAFAQTRVYTNADLGKKLPRTQTVTPEVLESRSGACACPPQVADAGDP